MIQRWHIRFRMWPFVGISSFKKASEKEVALDDPIDKAINDNWQGPITALKKTPRAGMTND